MLRADGSRSRQSAARANFGGAGIVAGCDRQPGRAEGVAREARQIRLTLAGAADPVRHVGAQEQRVRPPSDPPGRPEPTRTAQGARNTSKWSSLSA
jgi:hypothetical protein